MCWGFFQDRLRKSLLPLRQAIRLLGVLVGALVSLAALESTSLRRNALTIGSSMCV